MVQRKAGLWKTAGGRVRAFAFGHAFFRSGTILRRPLLFLSNSRSSNKSKTSYSYFLWKTVYGGKGIAGRRAVPETEHVPFGERRRPF
jgi:hypothetical protein